jgi:hypothetical protein
MELVGGRVEAAVASGRSFMLDITFRVECPLEESPRPE